MDSNYFFSVVGVTCCMAVLNSGVYIFYLLGLLGSYWVILKTEYCQNLCLLKYYVSRKYKHTYFYKF